MPPNIDAAGSKLRRAAVKAGAYWRYYYLLTSVGISVTVVIKLEVRRIVGRVESIAVDLFVDIDPVKACASHHGRQHFGKRYAAQGT